MPRWMIEKVFTSHEREVLQTYAEGENKELVKENKGMKQ